MQKIYDALINSFIENKIGIAENFLSLALASALKKNLNVLYASKELQSAGTGQLNELAHDIKFRSDKIYWLDKTHNDPSENQFFVIMDNFIKHLNETCYTGITNYEFHYTMYEPGTFYKKHIDQFKHNDSRQYSIIMYLNDDWKLQDGGELCIYNENQIQHISPTNGKIIFFKSSELEHEVLITHKPRMSITGWLKC
ncbi:MAG: 2OG-Fe(II) oxygenase [Bacteroidetes bacterium]|nr:2OG-Fe(II) oxygenase [Bacteroidota bacterium]